MLAASGCELQNHHSQRAATPGCEKRLDHGSLFLWTGIQVVSHVLLNQVYGRTEKNRLGNGYFWLRMTGGSGVDQTAAHH